MSPSAGLAARDPPSGVVRYADTSSAKKPDGEVGNVGIAPPYSRPDPKRPRAARAPTTIPRKQATITGCVETSETVRWRSLAAAGSSASPASSSRCSSKIRSAVVNQRGSRSPADSVNRRSTRSLIRRRFCTRRRARSVPGRCATFQPIAATTSNASSNRRDNSRKRSRTTVSTTPSGTTHANVSSPSFLRTDASAARSSSYRRLRSTPGRSSRSPTAAWRTRASGVIRTLNPAIRALQHRSRSPSSSPSRSSKSPLVCQTSRATSIAHESTDKTSRTRSNWP